MNLIKKLHDGHLHTKYSLDSEQEIKDYYEYASNAGWSYFITTEHIEFDSVINNQTWTVDFDNLIKELKELNKEYPNVTPLLGVEIGYRKDHLSDMTNLINSYDFDLINMSIHDNGKYDYYIKRDFLDIGIDNMLDIYFNNIIDGVKTFKNYDVLCHVDYGFKTAYGLDNTLRIENYEHYLKEIFEEVVKDDKVLEVNYKVQDTINDLNHLRNFLNIYKKYGGTKLSLSSDSHTMIQFNKYLESKQDLIDVIKECGFNELYYFVKRKQYKFEI